MRVDMSAPGAKVYGAYPVADNVRIPTLMELHRSGYHCRQHGSFEIYKSGINIAGTFGCSKNSAVPLIVSTLNMPENWVRIP